ncbi:energy-coupling factor ABC transporter permease [Salinibius halmophilus]|uniref:energy-coupling factor ABC transporter permease n=1 Tax=Salinibius halmophilus TaxID=1853216 RepID=UPI000E65F607|nr:energy-coupling factor ABC transporter permease [Salinibius halmophilus]
MNWTANELPLWLTIITSVAWAGIFVAAIVWGNWRELLANHALQHRMLGAAVCLLMIWWARAGVSPGLHLHFIGVTVVTLMLGGRRAIIAISLAMIGLVLTGREWWGAVGLTGLLYGLLPILATKIALWLTKTYLPKQPFGYIMIGGFFGAALSVLFLMFGITVVVLILDLYRWDQLVDQLWMLLPLMAIPEGFINGVVLSGIVVYYPDWLISYNEEDYYPTDDDN